MRDDEAIPDLGRLGRRGVLLTGAAGAAGVAVVAVAGCGTRPGSQEVPSGPAVVPAVEVPVGGGTILRARKVVVTQPLPGTFKAFSAVCTHRGCTVGEVAGGTINCPCHGSKFNISDGSVVEGPARRGLTVKQVTTDGTTLRIT